MNLFFKKIFTIFILILMPIFLSAQRHNKSKAPRETAGNEVIVDNARNKKVSVNKFDAKKKKDAKRQVKKLNKYDRKGKRLKRRYSLSQKEKLIINKSKGRKLGITEKIILNRALNKKEKHANKYNKLQKEKQFSIQSKKTRKQMKTSSEKSEERRKHLRKIYKKYH